MRSSRVSLRPGHEPVVGLGNTGEHVGLADLPADRGGHAVAEVVGQRAEPAARLREEVEQADLVEHPLVPVGRRADEPGESADPVGEAAGAGVDESRRERVPRGVLRERRVGEAGPHPIDEPAVEFVEPVVHPRHAVVASVGPVDRRRRHVVFVAVDRPGRRSRRRRRRGRSQAPGWRRPPMSDRRPAPAPLEPRRDVGGRDGVGDVAVDPQQQQREGVLARHPPARARAAERRRGRDRPRCRTARRCCRGTSPTPRRRPHRGWAQRPGVAIGRAADRTAGDGCDRLDLLDRPHSRLSGRSAGHRASRRHRRRTGRDSSTG